MNMKKWMDMRPKTRTHARIDQDIFNQICLSAKMPFDLLSILKPYCEIHRHFHTMDHVLNLLKQMESDVFESDVERNSFYCAALFHDIVYDPRRNDNESQSELIFCSQYKLEYDGFIDFNLVCELIRGTTLVDDRNASRQVRKFNAYDRIIFTKPVDQLIEYGEKIWREYSHVSYSAFLNGYFPLIRTLVCSTFHDDPMLEIYLENINEYEKVMKNKKIRVGIYAGSFNPFHLGHLDILQQAERLFDKVIIATGQNPDKIGTILTKKNTIPHIECEINGVPHRFEQVSFNTLLARYVEDLENTENYDITVIRGIRAESDLANELTQRKYSLEINKNLKYIFLASSPGLEHISSSAIRALQKFEEDVSDYLPPPTKGFLNS